MIAVDLGIDPIDIRLRNAMEPNTRTCNALDISSCEFRATLERAREASGWKEKKGRLRRGISDLPFRHPAFQRDHPRARGRPGRLPAHRGGGDRSRVGHGALPDRG